MHGETEKAKREHCSRMEVIAAERSHSFEGWHSKGERMGLCDPRSLKKQLYRARLRPVLRGAGQLVLIRLEEHFDIMP